MNAPEEIRLDGARLAATLGDELVDRPFEHELAADYPGGCDRDHRDGRPKCFATALAGPSFCLSHDVCPFTTRKMEKLFESLRM
ncbi:hypothetical protein D9M72_598380 [compost metagenome]